MLTESIEKSAETMPEKKICELCGKEFLCGAQIGECWCFAVDVKVKTLAELREDFKNCLCSDCLRKLK